MVGIMKIVILKLIVVVTLFVTVNLKAQDISFVPENTFLYATPGTEIVFDIEVTNLTAMDQTVFIVRSINNLPVGWTSALCFDLCFSSEVDSIATTLDFGSTPLAAGETRIVQLHFITNNNIATGHVELQAGTFRSPEDRIALDFTATTDPAVSVNDGTVLNSYSLSQNYPNPFNPSTQINYKVGEPGLVQLKVYNVLGVEVATLINEQKIAGNYTIEFDASRFSSGVYFYSISVNNFSQTRKMILEK